MPVAIRWLDHTAIAVRSIEAALPLYRDVLGGDPQELSEHPEKGFAALTLRYPHGGGIELIQPLGEDSFVQRFLERRGEGVHHVGYRVVDCAAALQAVKDAGGQVIDQQPRPGSRGTTVAFVHPKAAFGTLIELVQE